MGNSAAQHGMLTAGIAAGGSVVVIWIILALGRKWIAEPSVADRVGRLLGVTAIVAALVGLVVFQI
jgi:hypothetical protein